MLTRISELDIVDAAYIESSDMGSGTINIAIDMPRVLYYRLISSESGIDIHDDGSLVKVLRELGQIKQEYDKIKDALDSVRQTGYGVVMPQPDQLQIEEPQLVKQGVNIL